jgi:hypothetical protein
MAKRGIRPFYSEPTVAELLELQAELEQLERTDPEVGRAAAKYDTTVSELLKRVPLAKGPGHG